jgi:hypothetical protein
MNGIDIAVILGLYASNFILYYRLGKVEQAVKDITKRLDRKRG